MAKQENLEEEIEKEYSGTSPQESNEAESKEEPK